MLSQRNMARWPYVRIAAYGMDIRSYYRIAADRIFTDSEFLFALDCMDIRSYYRIAADRMFIDLEFPICNGRYGYIFVLPDCSRPFVHKIVCY